MENIILIVHLILALCLIGIVLLQRSEGGGLGIGGGGSGGVMSGRGAATALGKLTWFFAIAFIATSMTLTVIAAQKSASGSVVDQLGLPPVSSSGDSGLSLGENLLPPALDGPLAPPAVDEPLTPPRAE